MEDTAGYTDLEVALGKRSTVVLLKSILPRNRLIVTWHIAVRASATAISGPGPSTESDGVMSAAQRRSSASAN